MRVASAWALAASASPSWRAMESRRASRWSSRASSRCRRPRRSWGSCRTRRGSADQSLYLGNDLEEVADEAEIARLEDRRRAVLVDGDDGAGILDAREVLNRPRDPHRHIQLRRDDLAGLAD